MKSEEEAKYFLALSQEAKIRGRTLLKLLARFPTVKAVWQADYGDFKKKEVSPEIAKLVIELRKKIDPEEEMKKVKDLGISLLTIKDQGYPRLLKEIPDPPGLLYFRGDLGSEEDLAIAVIGSRRYSPYGRQAAEAITKPLAEAGLTIVSGLALGIDSFAHRAALGVKSGRTIAVLPCGLDRIYPISHSYLAKEITNGRGAIISEFPLGTPALPYNFPVRNRIIAGLSLGVIVIEASLESGSFLTARSALEYNREVFAAPGSIFSEKSKGTNNLIKMGAKLVTSAEDIIKELNLETRTKTIQRKKLLPETREEAILLEILTPSEPVHIDQIVLKSGMDIAQVNSTLILMEMKGKIRNLGANQYVINI